MPLNKETKPNQPSFGYVTGSNQCLYPLCYVFLRTHGTVDKGIGSAENFQRGNFTYFQWNLPFVFNFSLFFPSPYLYVFFLCFYPEQDHFQTCNFQGEQQIGHTLLTHTNKNSIQHTFNTPGTFYIASQISATTPHHLNLSLLLWVSNLNNILSLEFFYLKFFRLANFTFPTKKKRGVLTDGEAQDLENLEYLFIAIAPKPTLKNVPVKLSHL